MSKFKPLLYALFTCATLAGSGMAKAAVVEYDPVFSDPAQLFDVGDDDPYMYRWVTDPAYLETSAWAFNGSGLTAYAIASVWLTESLTIHNSQQSKINAGQPLFAISCGASSADSPLPYQCVVKLHLYGVVSATAYAEGLSGASSHASSGSAYVDDNGTANVDLGYQYVTVPLSTVSGRQPTVEGTALLPGRNVVAQVWNSCDNDGDYNYTNARAEIQYYIVSWRYAYRPIIGWPGF